MNVLSLFDGMSCGQIALNRAKVKYNNYFASEIDKYAIKVTQYNYPNTKQIGNVLKIKSNNLSKIDLLIGGSPCQGFSFAGKQLNFNDPRSKLFFEFVRLLKECKPKYFLLENVKMKQEYQNVISKYLGVLPIEINSSLVSAQNRKRLYWTNIRNIIQPIDNNVVLSDIIENGCLHTDKYYIIQRSRGFNKGGIKAKNGKTPPITSCSWQHNNHLYNNGEIRKLTPIECERLQTVPDDYTNVVSDTQRYRMLGNGWTVDVITHIFKGMI